MAGEATVTIHRGFAAPDFELIEALSGFPTGHFADIQDRRGALDEGIKPVFDCAPFIGSAVTVKTVPDDNLAPYAALDVLTPGTVLVIANGGWTGSAVIGDIIVGMFKNAGAVAVVTDGAVRDVRGLEAVGLPVHARAVSPNAPRKNGPGVIGGEISIGGVVVRSGDLLIGDRDGVVVLPRERFATALDGVRGIRDKEAVMEADIAAGNSKPDWLKEFLASDAVENTD